MEHLHPGSPPFPPGRLAGKKHARSLRRGNIGLMQSRPNSPPQKWAILRGATEAGSMDALRRHKPRIDGFLNSSLDSCLVVFDMRIIRVLGGVSHNDRSCKQWINVLGAGDKPGTG